MWQRHQQHQGLTGGRVLLNVASIIFDHYSICHAAAYVFSAAADRQRMRQTDLSVIYSRTLGLQGYPESKLFRRFAGWRAYSDIDAGGRNYVVTTENYSSAQRRNRAFVW